MFLCLQPTYYRSNGDVLKPQIHKYVYVVISQEPGWNEAETDQKFLNIHFYLCQFVYENEEEKTGNWRLIFLLWILQNRVREHTKEPELSLGEEGRSEWGGWVGGVSENIPSIVDLNP